MIPAVELIANQSKPTDRVFTILNKYSLTPGSNFLNLNYYKKKKLLFYYRCYVNQNFGY
jgi:hypothetical protein